MAFETGTLTAYPNLYDRVRAAIKDPNFMGYDLTLSGSSGTFVIGETVTAGGGKSGVVKVVGTSFLTIDAIAGGAPATGNVFTGGTSGAVGTINLSSSRAWTELYANSPGGGSGNQYVDKRCLLKNTGDPGTDEIWVTLQQVTDGGTAGIVLDGARYYDGLVGGWAGIDPVIGNQQALIPMANTGNATRDALKYWLVADRKRVILAVHTEYLIGGGQVLWGYSGYVLRWDPPSQYPQPHLVAAPGYHPYTTPANNFPYRDNSTPVVTMIAPTSPAESVGPMPLSSEPQIPHPDGNTFVLPVWLRQSFTSLYLGELDGLFFTTPNLAQGDTITVGGVTYVALQNYLPGHYAALRLF